MEPTETELKTPSSKMDLKNITIIIYALWACGLISSFVPLGGFLPIVGLIIALLKKDEAAGTIYQSHFTWVIRTFLISLTGIAVIIVIGLIPVIGILGIILGFAIMLWSLYRLVKGALRLYENKPVENPEAYL